ncbi:MAG: SIR2 family protein [Dehalococcoidia bacterium]
MWFREVDVPRPLVDAHRSGELVLFVGAGASIDPPSSLPTFDSLTAEVANQAQVEFGDADRQWPDRFLANLVDQGTNVHQLVHNQISASRRSNRLHRVIARLAASSPAARIVTTNYDLHLSRALRRRAGRFMTYRAPALPRGDDFEGVVYLHGNVDQDPDKLVVTERDFGGAYLTEAWATRFLERMFDRFTVLFIGYSHSDTVMRYLARGLRDRSRRYVLTPDAAKEEWRSYELNVIPYRVVKDSHAELTGALDRWAERSSHNLLEHRQQMKELLAGQPLQSPEDDSYLGAAVDDPARLGFFCEFADDPSWLTWVAKQPRFKALFAPGEVQPPESWPLAWWFAEMAANSEEGSDTGLRVLQDLGGRLCPMLWDALTRNILRSNPPYSKWLTRWVAVVLQQDPGTNAHALEYLLRDCRLPADRTIALQLFDHLSEPVAVLRESFGLGATSTMVEVQLRGDDHLVNDAFVKVLRPHLDDVSVDLLSIADRHLRSAYLLREATGASVFVDPMSFGRAAIAPNKHDERYGSYTALVDTARDALVHEVSEASPIGLGILSTWEQSEQPLLRRLAVHGWVHRPDVSASQKIDDVRTRGWLDDSHLDPEVFRLIAEMIVDATAASANRLISDLTTAARDGEESDAYRSFNMLAWIVKHRPDLTHAHRAYERIQAAHPDFRPETRPDLRRVFTMRSGGASPPMSVAELHERLVGNPKAAIENLRAFEHATGLLQEPSWQSTLDLVASTVRSHPEVGFVILDSTEDDQPDLVRATIRGWADSSVDDGMASRILIRLGALDPDPLRHELTYMLAHFGSSSESTEWHRHEPAKKLAASLWEVVANSDSDEDLSTERWLDTAINRDAGRLVRFWILAIADAWEQAGDRWDGLDESTAHSLEQILDTASLNGEFARVVLASHLLFLFDADPKWSRARLLPLLQWDDTSRAHRMWQGYLYGRWNDALLSAGLFDAFGDALDELDDFTDDACGMLLDHLAGIALTSHHDPSPLLKKLATTGSDEHNTTCMSRIAWLMSTLPAEAIEGAWERWMESYWTERVNGAPRALTNAQATAIAGWAVHLTEHFPDAVRLATAVPAGLGEPSVALDDIDNDLIKRWPHEAVKLLEHLLAGTKSPFHGCHRLEEVVTRLRANPEPLDLTNILDHAVRVGCRTAPDW